MDTLQTSQGKPGILPYNLPDLQSQLLVDMEFAIISSLVRLELPRIRFLFVRS
jgi:hypothetical protein